jgi:hypothetical protein
MLTPKPHERHARDDQVATASALFGRDAANSATPLVTVKRRRISAPVNAAAAVEPPEPAVRQPKVHRIERLSDNAELRGDSARVVAEAAMPLPAVTAKRPRRRLHGKVEVVTRGSMAGEEPAPPVNQATALETNEVAAPTDSFIGKPDRRYAALVAQINALRAEGEVLRRREKSDALRWARKAVLEFGITARDLGL